MAALMLLGLGLTEKPPTREVPPDDKLFLPVPVSKCDFLGWLKQLKIQSKQEKHSLEE